jgi:hypothetical protein
VVQVTTPQFVNVYEYQAKDLYIAYGVSILVSVVCVAIGFIAISRNSGAYMNNFSTILRTTRDDSLDDLVTITDTNGIDPLGKDLGRARVRMVIHPEMDRSIGFQSM